MSIEAEFSAKQEIDLALLFPQLLIYSSLFRTIDSLLRQDSIVDFRGRPKETFTEKLKEVSPPEHEEEVFFAEGYLYDLDFPREKLGCSLSELERHPFQVRIGTKFDSFLGQSHISHGVKLYCSSVLEELRNDIDLILLSRLIPAKLEKLRFGLEAYHPSAAGGIFGQLPTIKERVYLEMELQQIKLNTSCEFKRSAMCMPFESHGLIEGVDSALRKLNYFPNFAELVRSQL